jgi:hypothetical protein
MLWTSIIIVQPVSGARRMEQRYFDHTGATNLWRRDTHRADRHPAGLAIGPDNGP